MHDNFPTFYLRADSGELGANGCLKPAGYHELICRIIEAGQAVSGCSLSDTLSRGYAWAMVSLSMQVYSPIRSCGKLLGQTWLSELEYPHMRREIELYDEQGKSIVSASIFMVPISIETHGIQPADALMDISFNVEPIHSLEWAEARMRSIHDQRYQSLDLRTVHPSDIDALGHLNNCRYGAYAYDVLAALGRDVTDRPFRYTMHFMRQCMSGTQLSIGAYEDDGTVHLLGIGKDDKLKRFCVVVKGM